MPHRACWIQYRLPHREVLCKACTVNARHAEKPDEVPLAAVRLKIRSFESSFCNQDVCSVKEEQ